MKARIVFTVEELTIYLAHKLEQDGKIGSWTHASLGIEHEHVMGRLPKVVAFELEVETR